MKTLSKQEKHNVYVKALELHLKDVKFSKSEGYEIYGLCEILENSLLELGFIKSFEFNFRRVMKLLPEFAKLKPKSKDIGELWWSAINTNTTRIKKLKQLIKQTS